MGVALYIDEEIGNEYSSITTRTTTKDDSKSCTVKNNVFFSLSCIKNSDVQTTKVGFFFRLLYATTSKFGFFLDYLCMFYHQIFVCML